MPLKEHDLSVGPLPPFLRNLPHHRSYRVVKTLDTIFHFIKWVWLAFIVGGLIVATGLNIAQYGDLHLDHPERWKIWLFAQAHPIASIALAAILPPLTLLCAIAHLTAMAHPPKSPPPTPEKSPFTRVRDLDRVSFPMGDRKAATFPYIRSPVEAIYQQAIATLRAAAADSAYPKQGILVTGEANAGKTRLALEALIAALPDWDVLLWNRDYREDKIPTAAQLKGRSVVVLLDDIKNYATGGAIASDTEGRSTQESLDGKSVTLQTMYQRICQEAAMDGGQVVFVATCRREEKKAAESSLGWLFEKLDELAVPTFNRDEDSLEARAIIGEFAQVGKVHDEWDGTLGSLVLGLGRKREEYLDMVNWNRPAVAVLRAMKLLTIGGVHGLTGRRVHAVCDQILHKSDLAASGEAWDDALERLKRLEFVSITTDADDVTLAINKDDYFKYVVDDYPPDYQRDAHRSQLLNALTSLDDDEGLFYLGNGFYYDDQFPLARTAYQKAITLNRTYVGTYIDPPHG